MKKTLLKTFIDKSHIYRPLVAFQKTYEGMWLFKVTFKISSIVIDYNSLVIDYAVV